MDVLLQKMPPSILQAIAPHIPTMMRWHARYQHRKTVIHRSFWVAFLVLLAARALSKSTAKKDGQVVKATPSTVIRKKGKEIKVDAEFYRKLRRIIKVIMPHWRSKEAAMLVFHSSFLVFRTFLSVYIAELDGRIVSNLVFTHFSSCRCFEY